MRMMGERWRVLGDYDVAVGTIVRIEDAEPEQLLAAAVLVMAVREAVEPKVLRIVREDAIDFLATPRCLGWIQALCDEREPEVVQRALLERVTDVREAAGMTARQTLMTGVA